MLNKPVLPLILLFLNITKTETTMGLFDFFKKRKKDNTDEETPDISDNTGLDQNINPVISNSGKSINERYAEINAGSQINTPAAEEHAPEDVFAFVFKYGGYVARYIQMMLDDNHSPIAAYENNDATLTGYLFVAEDMSYNLSVEQVIQKMEAEFEQRMTSGSVVSWAIFYHSEFNNDGTYKVADRNSKTRAICMKYKTNDGTMGFAAIPYTFKDDEVSWRGFNGFSFQQNKQILSIQLEPHKDYFQEKVEITPPVYENEAGIKVKTVNNGSLGNMWSGLFGFERISKGSNIILEYMALVFAYGSQRSNDDVTVFERQYDDVILRGVKTADDSRRTAYPVIKTTAYIDVENKQIAEWKNSDNLEAVITGGGRDTFGVTYFATDYAENKLIYHSEKKINIAFSGMLYILRSSDEKEDKLPDGTPFAEGFVAYLPHKELAEFGCYDFIGILEDFRPISVLEANIVSGYILKIRLINNQEITDFFTIPMFINTQNMRVDQLEKGMKISGMFQLQGEIVK